MKRINLKKQLLEAIKYLKETKKEIYLIILLFLFSAIVGFLLRNRLSFIESFLQQILNKTLNYNYAEITFFILQNNLQSAFIALIFGIFFGIFPILNASINGLIVGFVLARASATIGLQAFWRLLPHGIFELPAIFISLGIGLKLGSSTLTVYFKKYENNNTMKIIGIGLIIICSIGLLIFGSSMNLSLNSIINQKIGTMLKLMLFFGSMILIIPFLLLFIFSDKKTYNKFKNNLYNSINVFFIIVLPLLIIAAIIEGLLILFFKQSR